MDIKQEFREETDMDVYASYGNNGSFNNVYVKWLEAKLALTDVSQQRELLLAYEDYLNEYHTKEDRIKQVDKYLKANNCG